MRQWVFRFWFWLGVVSALSSPLIAILLKCGWIFLGGVLCALIIFGCLSGEYCPGRSRKYLLNGTEYFKHGQEHILGGGSWVLVWLSEKYVGGEILSYQLPVPRLHNKDQQHITKIPSAFIVLKYQNQYHLIETE
jgi:hypothetical protein